MREYDLREARWRKSTYSDGNGNAVFRFHVGDALVAPPGDPVATIIEYQAPFLSLIPSQEFLLTYNAFGQRIPPLLRLTDTKTMLGTIDVPEGLMQVAQSVGTTSIAVDFESLVEADDTAQARRVGPIRLPTTPATPDLSTPMTAQFTALNNSGIGGDIQVSGEAEQTRVVVQLTGSTANGVHQGHVHTGTCEAPGANVIALQPVTIGADGTGRSESTVAVAPMTAMNGQHIVMFHEANGQPGAPVACAAIPAHAM